MSFYSLNIQECPLQSLVSGVDKWVLSDIVTPADIYYYSVDDLLEKPLAVYINGSKATENTGTDVTALSTGEWIWGDENGLGRNTIYIRLVDESSPDSKTDNYVQCSQPIEVDLTITDTKKLVINLTVSNYDNSSSANIRISKEDSGDNFISYVYLNSSLSNNNVEYEKANVILNSTDKMKVHSDIENVSADITVSTSEIF